MLVKSPAMNFVEWDSENGKKVWQHVMLLAFDHDNLTHQDSDTSLADKSSH